MLDKKQRKKSARINGREWVNEARCIKCFACSSRVGKHYIRTSPITVFQIYGLPKMHFFKLSPVIMHDIPLALTHTHHVNITKMHNRKNI